MSGTERSQADGAQATTSVMLAEREFILLNVIHLKKIATTEQVVALTGIDTADVQAVLAGLSLAGLVLCTDNGHMLMPDGTLALRHYYDRHYAALRREPTLTAWYTRFEGVNHRFIAAVSEWQQHRSDTLMFKALDLVEQLCDALDELIPLIPRYTDYVRRFEIASNNAESGDHEFLCNPRYDSAHNIWFEFHEDILGVLGRPRDTS